MGHQILTSPCWIRCPITIPRHERVTSNPLSGSSLSVCHRLCAVCPLRKGKWSAENMYARVQGAKAVSWKQETKHARQRKWPFLNMYCLIKLLGNIKAKYSASQTEQFQNRHYSDDYCKNECVNIQLAHICTCATLLEQIQFTWAQQTKT